MSHHLTRVLLRMVLWALIWMFYALIALGVAIAKLVAGRWLLRDTVECPTCRGDVPLLGLWECSVCRFRYYGFYFSRCICCGNVPTYIDCINCGASILSPLS